MRPSKAVGHLDSWTVGRTAGLLLPDGQMISSEFTKIGKILARWYLEQWRARGEPVGVVFVIRPDHWEIVLHGTELGTIIHVRGEERTIQTDINKVGPTQIPSQRSLCFGQRIFRRAETPQNLRYKSLTHVSLTEIMTLLTGSLSNPGHVNNDGEVGGTILFF